MKALLAEVVDIGDTGYRGRSAHGEYDTKLTRELTASDENLVRPVFISKLGGIAFPGFLGRKGSVYRRQDRDRLERTQYSGEGHHSQT